MDPPPTIARQPVEGEQIPPSRSMFLFFVIVIVGSGVLCSVWLVKEFEKAPAADGRPDGISLRKVVPLLGGLGIIFGVIQMVRVWLRDERLILGQDRLQILERGAEVKGEIPYDNIAEIVLKKQPRSGPLLLLRLHEPGRPDTYWPQPAGFAGVLRQMHGCDVMISHQTGYAVSNSALHDKLAARWQAFQASKPSDQS